MLPDIAQRGALEVLQCGVDNPDPAAEGASILIVCDKEGTEGGHFGGMDFVILTRRSYVAGQRDDKLIRFRSTVGINEFDYDNTEVVNVTYSTFVNDNWTFSDGFIMSNCKGVVVADHSLDGMQAEEI